jgi:flavin-dependent dehydrogenase
MLITIVGAGPVGCYLGQLLTRAGLTVTLLEEHPEIGLPQHCAGLVGQSFFKHSRIPLPQTLIRKRLNGAIVEHKQHRFALKRRAAAYVVDRVALDQKLAEGLTIHKPVRCIGLKKSGKDWSILTSEGVFHSRVIIGADGATSTIRQLANFKLNPSYYRGLQLRIRKKMDNSDQVRVWFNKPFLDFCWAFSESDSVVRVGSISRGNPRGQLLQFLQDTALTGPVIEQMAGTIPFGYGQTRKGNLALVGDAACQLKPLSGGGLYYGMRCAEVLADCLAHDNLAHYEQAWKRSIGREIRHGLRIRRYLERRDNAFLEKLFLLAQKHKDIIEQSALFEEHSVSFFRVARQLALSLPGLYIEASMKSILENRHRG